MNFFNRKNQKRIASVICILVIIAMVLPMVLEYFSKIVHRRGYKGRLFYKDRMDALLLFAFVDSEIAAA